MTQFRLRQRLAFILRRFPYLLVIPYHVFRFFHAKFSMGVVGVLFNDAGQVLLVEHVLHPRMPWGLPGGWIDHNEDPAEAVVRELKEELNLSVDIVQVITVEKTEYNHTDVAFLCRVTAGELHLSHELLNYGWYDLDTMPLIRRFHVEVIQKAKALMIRNERNERSKEI